MSVVGDNIRKYRTQQGMTLRELGEKIGASRQMVSAYECGEGSQPSIMTLNKLADALKVSPGDLLGCGDGASAKKVGEIIIKLKDILANEGHGRTNMAGGLFPERLNYYRTRAGLTRSELANMADISAASLSYFEKNEEGLPSVRTIEKLAGALKINPATLMGWDNDQTRMVELNDELNDVYDRIKEIVNG